MSIFHSIVKWLNSLFAKKPIKTKRMYGIPVAPKDGEHLKEAEIHELIFESNTCWFWVSDDFAMVVKCRSGLDC